MTLSVRSRGYLVRHSARTARRRPRAATLVEATVSILIVGTMLVAALSAAAASRSAEQKLSDQVRGALLAHTLMGEITRLSYADPETGLGSLLLELNEIGDGSRALWDDVDDYNGFSETGPRLKNGAALTGFEDWRWSATVFWVSPSNLRTGVGAESGAKVIRVRVLHGSNESCVLLSLRTNKTIVANELDGLLDIVNDVVDGLLGILGMR